MPGRKGVLLASLIVLTVLGLASVWLLLEPPGPRTGPRLPGDADRAARAAWVDDQDPTQATDPRGTAPGQSGPGDAEVVRPIVAIAHDDNAADSANAAPAPTFDPETVNAPVPGHLLIRVQDASDERPLPGASMFFPLLQQALPADGGDVKLPFELAGMRKRANRHGVCLWSEAELKRARKPDPASPTSVLLTHPGFADLFEPLTIPDLSKGAEVNLKLHAAVRVQGKVREKRGGMVKHVTVDVLQTSRQGEAAAPRNRLSVQSDALGEFALKVAEAYTYRFEVRLPGYAPYLSREFDFRRDEKVVTILLEPGRGISGVVVNHRGAPIEGALVRAPSETLFANTDDQGRFSFDMVRDRVWTNEVALRVSAEGYATRGVTALANDHNLRVELEPEGTLTAVVVTERDEPVPGAIVACTFIEGNARFPYDAVAADEAGAVRFGGFAQGRVMLTATWQNLASQPVTVDVEPRREVKGIKLVLRAGASITGRVTGGGMPIAGATISLDGKPAGATADDGSYTIEGIQAGEHTVRVVNQFPISDATLRQLPVFTTDGAGYYYLPAERKLKLNLAATEIVDFECPPFDAKIDRKITVNVVARPAESATGVQVTLKPLFGAPPPGVEAPKTLAFALDLPHGRAEVPLSLLDGVTYEMTATHNRFFPATIGAEALAGVPDGGAIELLLERAFIIKGYVRDSQGAGLENVGLSRDRNNPWAQTATTDIHGYFEFGQLREGDYLVTAFKTSYYQERAEVVVAGADPAPLQLTMVSANEIRIVVTKGGTPQPGARLHVYRNDTESDDPDAFKRHFDIGTTDANGVKYINFHWVRNYQIVAYYSEEVAFVNFNNMREVPEREVAIELEPAQDLRGQVVDADTGLPLPGVYIRAHIAPTSVEGRDGNFFQLQTDGSGVFNFRVPAGSYSFYVPRTASHQSFTTGSSYVPAGSAGHVLPVPLRDDIQGNYAQILGLSVPSTMVAGQSYEVVVTVRNMGNSTWTRAGNQPWRLGSQSPRDNNRWGMTRVPLPEGIQVAPRDTVVFRFNVTAPANAGTHAMQWQMVQDGREWFGQLTPREQITVTPAN